MHNMEQWLSNICMYLRDTTIPQITNKLVMFDIDGIVSGKCALGVISCNVGLPLTRYNYDTIAYQTIMEHANVPVEYILERGVLPYLSTEVENGIVGYDVIGDMTLSNYIYLMNDDGFSFKEIADFLETTFSGHDSSIPLLDRA